MTNGYYLHLPGQLSRRGCIDVGLRCPSRCLHCFTREPERADEGKDFERNNKSPWRPTEQLIQQARNMGLNGFLATDFTGGEGTLHPGIVEVVRACVESNVAPRIITLGQFLDRKKNGENLLNRLLEAGLADMRFSYHACTADLYKTITGGDIAKEKWAMRQLDEAGFQYTTNTTILECNYKTLPDIARDLLAHNIYYANFIYFMPHYDWSAMVNNSIRPKYTDAAPYLREAVDILEGNGIAVGVRYAPQCTIAGLEKNHAGITSVYYDPHEWMNAVEHSGEGDAFREGNWRSMKPGDPSPGAWLLQEKIGGPIIARGSPAGISKVFMDQCHECSAQKVCDGVDQSYIDTYGPGEFVPYINDPRGEILDRDRQRYFAGHVVKRLPFADVKSVTKRILKPEPISERPMVSVFIANYNYADWVGKAIKSVLDQTYRNIELIVVDDASTDTSRQEILKALDLESLDVEGFTFGGDVLGRRQFIWRQTNSGGNPATCHNDALYRSRGELVCYLDSDDWFEPSYIEEAVACLKQNPWASYVYPGLSTFGTVEEQWPATPFDPHQEIMGNFIPYCVVARRSMYDDLEGYHEGCRGADDWYNWVKAIRLGHFGVPLPRQLMHYNRKDDGIFVAEVKPNYRKKQLHVYLDNYEAYQAEVIHWARAEAKKDGP